MSSAERVRLLAVLAWLLQGCATEGLVFRSAQYRVPERVAVLPFDNETTSLLAPDMLRGFAAQELSAHGYASLPLDESDRRLKALGITEGGQLKACAPAELGRVLEADALLYGTVEDFSYQNLGFLRRRLVRLRLRLVAAADGERLWEGVGVGSGEKVALQKGAAARSFVEGLVEQALEGATRVQLDREARIAASEALKTLPGR